MKIRSRIFLGYLLLATPVVIVGAVGYHSTHRVGAEFDQAINRTQPVLAELHEMRFRIAQVQTEAHEIVHPPANAAADPQATLQALDAAARRYVALVQRYFADEIDEAEEIAAKVEQFKAEVEALTTRRPAGEAGHAHLAAIGGSARDLLVDLEKAAAHELTEFAEYQAGVDKQTAAYKNNIVFIGLAALFAALLAGVHLATRLARPIVALRDAVKQVGEGDLQTRSTFADGSEVGELAQTFNRMAEQLSRSMVSRAYVEGIIDSMREGMLVVDPDGRIERVNRGFRSLLGAGDDDSFAGQTIGEYFPALRVVPGSALASADRRSLEAALRTRSGETLVVSLSVAPLQTGASAAGTVVLVHDISERKRAEAALRELNERLEGRVEERTRELADATRAAKTASQAKSAFLANMSHEIRTPMNSVLGMAHLALRRDLPRKERGYIENIITSGHHLLHLINDILDISKIEAGHLQLECVDFEPAEVVDKVREVSAAKAAAKGLALHFDLDPALARPLRGDPLRLGQVLINLVDNAIKFTERGSVTLRARHVPCGETGCCCVRFEVADTGIGMSGDEVRRIFQTFQQADASTSRRFGGSGLGLAISQELARLMGGEIEVKSEPGQGTTFWFTARLAIGEACPSTDPEAALAAGAMPPILRGARVLLAEDNLFNQQVACELLEDAGAIVCIANDGEEALALLRQAQFDCVLMDVQMPTMDGYEAARQIRADAALKDLRVIAMTANATNEDRSRCLAAGMNDFITKPVMPQRLYAVLAAHLSGVAPARPEAPAVPAPAAASADEAVIDFGVLAATVNNDPAKLRKYAKRFLATTRDALAEIEAALAQEDMLRLGELGHRTKAAARAVGAPAFGDLCEALEGLQGPADAVRAAEVVVRLRALFGQISEAVAQEWPEQRTAN